jgi:uncharacterized protein YodC (DUF2158 family)
MTTEKTPIGVASVVQLKSGGDWMTVEATDRGFSNCVWFDKSGNLRRQKFPNTLLTNQQDAFSFDTERAEQ